jgi:precorrin-6A/cobalt-precorrin-6A reductase
LLQEQITQIIDASHPFAGQISALAQDLAQELHLAYVRYQRRELPLTAGVIEIASLEDLFSQGLLQGRRVFLTLGAKSLPFFRDYQDQAALFARILPTASSLELAQRGGFLPERLIALRLPVSEALETALWQQWRIETVVTKASGAPGGEAIKTQLAQRLQIPLIRLARPASRSATTVSSLEDLINWFKFNKLV